MLLLLYLVKLVEALRNWDYYSCKTNENTCPCLRNHSWLSLGYTLKYKERMFISIREHGYVDWTFSRTRGELLIDHDIHLIKHFLTFCLCHTFSSVYSYICINMEQFKHNWFLFYFESFQMFAMLPSRIYSLSLSRLLKWNGVRL